MAHIHYNGISIPLPPGWQDGTQVIALGPPAGEFRPNLVVSQEAARPGETVEQFAARQLAALKQALTQYAVVKEGPATFGGLSGMLREHSFTSGPVKLGQLQLYVLMGPVAYTFTFTDVSKNLPQSRAAAEQLFATARVGGGGSPGGAPAAGGGAPSRGGDGFF